MQPLASLLKTYGRAAGPHQPLGVARVVAVAQAVLDSWGSQGTSLFGPVHYFKNNTLAIRCPAGSAAQELKLKERELCAAINQRLGAALVKKIICSV